jgi:lipoprotein-releasing system permease protein
MLVVMVVANGMIEGITSRLIEVGTYHLQVVGLSRVPEERREELLQRVREAPGVEIAFVERQGLGLVYSAAGRIGLQIRAVAQDLWERDAGLRKYLRIVDGRFDLASTDDVVLGRKTAEELGVGIGDVVKVLTAKPIKGRFVPRVTRLRVTGVFSSGYEELDKGWIYVSAEAGRAMLPPEGSRQVLAIKVADPYRGMNEPLQAIRSALLDMDAWLRVATWYELEENQYRSFQTTKAMLIFIMGLIVLVAAVNVSSSLVMVVLEKTREIGILRSIGATPGTIARSYLIVGFLIGAAGSLVGIPLGLMIAVNVNGVIRLLERGVNAISGLFALAVGNAEWSSVSLLDPAFYLESIPVRVNLTETLLAAALAMLVSTAAALIPARRAARIRPLEVLRRY